MSVAGLVAQLKVLGSGEEGTGPGLALTVARVAEYSGEETPLVQVARTLFRCFSREAMDNARAFAVLRGFVRGLKAAALNPSCTWS